MLNIAHKLSQYIEYIQANGHSSTQPAQSQQQNQAAYSEAKVARL